MTTPSEALNPILPNWPNSFGLRKEAMHSRCICHFPGDELLHSLLVGDYILSL